jgi:hypothetical protein
MPTETRTNAPEEDDNWLEACEAEHPALYAELRSLIERYGLQGVQDALDNLESS